MLNCKRLLYKCNQDILLDFITERIYGIFPHINASIIRSVLMRKFGIAQSFNKILALSNYFEHIDIKSIISTFKRVANILQCDNIKNSNIDTSLFEDSEKILYDNLLKYINSKNSNNNIESNKDSNYYLSCIKSVFLLKENLDSVFDNVLINIDDENIRKNRIMLISLVFNEFMEFGDMREISI